MITLLASSHGVETIVLWSLCLYVTTPLSLRSMTLLTTDLPRGTVTLVFTDIEGSTRLLASLGSRYEAVLADHRTLLRAAFQSHAGTEVDTQGDALFYAFAKAHDAVTAAAEAQRALASHDFGSGVQLKVRMGIHTGEPTLTQEGYVGSDVHLGARICAARVGRPDRGLIGDRSPGVLGSKGPNRAFSRTPRPRLRRWI